MKKNLNEKKLLGKCLKAWIEVDNQFPKRKAFMNMQSLSTHTREEVGEKGESEEYSVS